MKQESTATLSQRLLFLAYYAIRGDDSHCAFFWDWWIWKKSCWCSALKTGNISGCWPQDVSEYSCEHLPQLDSECTGTNHTHHGEIYILPWPHTWKTYIDQTKKDPDVYFSSPLQIKGFYVNLVYSNMASTFGSWDPSSSTDNTLKITKKTSNLEKWKWLLLRACPSKLEYVICSREKKNIMRKTASH